MTEEFNVFDHIPCPYCGGESYVHCVRELVGYGGHLVNQFTTWFECIHCGATTPKIVKYCDTDITPVDQCVSEAFAATTLKGYKPEVKAQWTIKKGVLHPLETDGICSHCGYATSFYDLFDFCPRCGADMR